MFSEELARLISKKFDLDKEKVLNLIEVPPNPEMGDFAFPCFTLAKALKKSPAQIASENTDFKADFLKEVKAVGPYINFFIKNEEVAKRITSTRGSITSAIEQPIKTKVSTDKKEVVVIESPSPNTNKPLHLGHVRNMLLGKATRNLYKELENKIIITEIVNDKGIHICKSMLAYKLFGEGETPESSGVKGDHFVGKYYVKFESEAKKDPYLHEKAKEMLIKWEQGDEETVNLWEKMRRWCVKGFEETYSAFNMNIDIRYNESNIYKDGKKIVKEGLDKGVFKKEEDGAIYVDLESEGLGKKYLQRSDGTSIYITQDIFLGKKRFEELNMDRMIYVVASEQDYHFKVLFKIFKLLNYDFSDKCYHLSYGMVHLPSGRMKSREGTVVDADKFRSEVIGIARKELEERYELEEKELNHRAEVIGMGALKFFILKYDSHKDMTYNPEESLSFSGETGPYVQYTYSRICSIFRKTKEKPALNPEMLSENLEKQLIFKLQNYENVIKKAASNYKPNMICSYLLELSQLTTQYYHEHQIISEDKKLEASRLFLLDKVRETLKHGLKVLDINVLEEM